MKSISEYLKDVDFSKVIKNPNAIQIIKSKGLSNLGFQILDIVYIEELKKHICMMKIKKTQKSMELVRKISYNSIVFDDKSDIHYNVVVFDAKMLIYLSMNDECSLHVKNAKDRVSTKFVVKDIEDDFISISLFFKSRCLTTSEKKRTTIMDFQSISFESELTTNFSKSINKNFILSERCKDLKRKYNMIFVSKMYISDFLNLVKEATTFISTK